MVQTFVLHYVILLYCAVVLSYFFLIPGLSPNSTAPESLLLVQFLQGLRTCLDEQVIHFYDVSWL